MKTFLLIIFCSSFIGMHAQEMNFEQTVSFIQQKIHCCSVPYAASTTRKVDSIFIERSGDVRLTYSDKKPPLRFNIFQLYKDEETKDIDTVMGGKFVQFYLNEEKIRMIRFASAKDAGQVYKAFLQLYILCSKENKIFNDLNFKETVNIINIRLAKWAEGGADIQVNAKQDGELIITNKKSQTFRFNLFDLSTVDDGIEMEFCDVRSHAPSAWINFKNASTTIAFIRLHCNTPEAELDILRAAFLHLKTLSRKIE